jgi:RNA polymerase primary sigma factor
MKKKEHNDYESYFKGVGRFKLLTREEENALARKIKDTGDQGATEHLVTANLRLVVKVARAFVRSGRDIGDLIAEGNLGLIIAAKRFDPDFGTRFSSYAVPWIKQSIMRYLCTHAQIVSIPPNKALLRSQFQRYCYSESQGSMSEDSVCLKKASSDLNVKEKDIEDVIRLNAPTMFLDDKDTLVHTAPAFLAMSTQVTEIAKRQLSKLVKNILQKLSPRERDIIKLRFGLDCGDSKAHTLQEIGTRQKLTRERVRQIEGATLRQLKRILHKQGYLETTDILIS